MPPADSPTTIATSRNTKIYAQEPVPPGTTMTQLPTNNLREYILPDTTPFAEKAIRWYRKLLLHPEEADDMTGIDNRILITYGMCPPCTLPEYYQMDPENQPTHFMQGTSAEIWGTDTHEVMYTTAADWETKD